MIKTVEDSVLTQSEKDDVVLALVREGGIFSKTPPTDVNEMKEFIEKYRDEVEDLFDSYMGSDKISINKSNNIREITNIDKFFHQVIVPAVESLSSEGKLNKKDNTHDTPRRVTLPQPLTEAYESYQASGPKFSRLERTSPKSVTERTR